MKKLAIITTHPIQYNAPWFRLLAERKKVALKVFYTWGQLETESKYDPGFGKNIAWDIPFLQGYEYSFVKNISKDPGSHHYNGIDNPSLVTEIKNYEPDAVLIFGWNFKSHLQAINFFYKKIPVLFRGDSTLLDNDSNSVIKNFIKKIYLKKVYKKIDAALYTGLENKKYFMHYRVPEKKLVFAPHAIDNKRFACANSSERKNLYIPDNATVFLFAGKLEEKKDPLLLLDAFVQLNDTNSFLMMVGNGNLETDLKKKVESLSAIIKERILFTGFQNQTTMPGIYKMADVFVLPSKGPGETWGLAVNEAMACSLPVLVSDKCGCYPDLVKEGINGTVFKHGDKQDLCKKMKLLLQKKNELKEMGKESAGIISHWSFENICASIENNML